MRLSGQIDALCRPKTMRICSLETRWPAKGYYAFSALVGALMGVASLGVFCPLYSSFTSAQKLNLIGFNKLGFLRDFGFSQVNCSTDANERLKSMLDGAVNLQALGYFVDNFFTVTLFSALLALITAFTIRDVPTLIRRRAGIAD